MKTCKTCCYSRRTLLARFRGWDLATCHRPENYTQCPVSGEVVYNPSYCSVERRFSGMCGPEGVHWTLTPQNLELKL